MKILSVDTAHNFCSVALMINGRIVEYVHDTALSMQAELLFVIIEKVLSDANICYKDLDALSVNVGPGSFTGIRLGLAAIKGINLVTDIPIVAVTSLQALAGSVMRSDGDILAVLDAKRKQVYCQLFDDSLNEVSKPCLLEYSQILNVNPKRKTYLIGNGSKLVEHILLNAGFDIKLIDFSCTSDAVSIANIANLKITTKQAINHNISPLYIRLPDAKKAKNI